MQNQVGRTETVYTTRSRDAHSESELPGLPSAEKWRLDGRTALIPAAEHSDNDRQFRDARFTRLPRRVSDQALGNTDGIGNRAICSAGRPHPVYGGDMRRRQTLVEHRRGPGPIQ